MIGIYQIHIMGHDYQYQISFTILQKLIKLSLMNEGLKDIHYFTTSLASVATLFSFWRAVKFTYCIQQKKSTIKKLENSQVLSVEQLKNRGLKVNEVVIVRGNVSTQDGRQVEKTLPSGKREKIAINLRFMQAIYSNDSFKKENYNLNIKEALKTSTIEGSTKLSLYSEDIFGQRNSILLRNFDQKDFSRVLEIISWEQTKRPLSLAQHINAILLGLIRALVMIGSQTKNVDYLRGIQIGKRQVEAELRVGASISVLGTIGLTLDGQFTIDPQRIFKDRLTELTILREQIDALIDKRNLWFLGSVVGIIYLGRRVYKYCKQNQIKLPFTDI